jgi:hypothetical protein
MEIDYTNITETMKPIVIEGVVIGMEKIKRNLMELLESGNLSSTTDKLLVYDIIGMIDIEIDDAKKNKMLQIDK